MNSLTNYPKNMGRIHLHSAPKSMAVVCSQRARALAADLGEVHRFTAVWIAGFAVGGLMGLLVGLVTH